MQMEGFRRRRHAVNGQAERRKDRTGLGECHGAAARDLQQCRPVEAAEHDAEASVERHLAEHLRRRHPGGKNCLGYPRLLLAEPRRETCQIHCTSEMACYGPVSTLQHADGIAPSMPIVQFEFVSVQTASAASA